MVRQKIEEGVKQHIIKLHKIDKAKVKEIVQIIRNTYDGLELSGNTIYNIINPRDGAAITKDTGPAKRKYKKKDPVTSTTPADPKDTVKLISEIETLIQDLHETYVQRLMSIRSQLITAIVELKETGKK